MTASAVLVGMVAALAALLLMARYTETRRLQSGASSHRLTFPAELEADGVERLLASLTGLLWPWWRRLISQPAVVFEVRADVTGITHYLTVPPAVDGQVASALQAHLPGVRTEPVELAPWRPTAAVGGQALMSFRVQADM